MILLLGHTGYMGSAFQGELTARGERFKVLPRETYSNFTKLYLFIRDNLIHTVINCAGFAGKPNVDECEKRWLDTLRGNVLLAGTIGHACAANNVRLVHLSSGCIYTGAGIYSESDPPNFNFKNPPCSYYVGTKSLGEEYLSDVYKTYILRLRLPFDEFDGPRNYISKLLNYPLLLNGRNSLTHRNDFVEAALDILEKRPGYGIYNLTNPGSVTTEEVVGMIKNHLQIKRDFEYWDDADFARQPMAPRSTCVLSTDKLADSGVIMRPVKEALEDALSKWKYENKDQAIAPLA